MTGAEHAVAEIRAGRARARALWIILKHESDRDAFALKPDPWEGPGEYQMVEYDGKRFGVLVKLPDDGHASLDTLAKGGRR